MINQQREFNRIGMIKINFLSLFKRDITVISVIGILWYNDNLVIRKHFHNFSYNSSFS